jgi:hypothetical protein
VGLGVGDILVALVAAVAAYSVWSLNRSVNRLAKIIDDQVRPEPYLKAFTPGDEGAEETIRREYESMMEGRVDEAELHMRERYGS